MATFIKHSALSVFCLLFLLVPSQGTAQSQMEMNRQASEEFDKADAELNAVYDKVARKLDKEGAAKLKNVQRTWVAFRDAQATFAADQEARGGSLAPLVYDATLTELTEKRTLELRELLKERE